MYYTELWIEKKTGQLKLLVYEGWTLSMKIISNIILRCDFSESETTDKNIMCIHLKTVKYTFIWQAIPS